MDDSNKSVLRFRVINCDRRPLSIPVPSRLVPFVRVSFPLVVKSLRDATFLAVNPYSTHVPHDAEPR